MTFQQYILQATRAAASDFFKYADHVPADKLEWKPLESGRSVLDIAQEVSMCCQWAADILSGKEIKWDEEAMEAMGAAMAVLNSLDLCKAKFEETFAVFETTVSGLSDDDLKKTVWLPFGNRDFTFKENCEYPHWNIVYHQGQVAYIQTLYGDREMYF